MSQLGFSDAEQVRPDGAHDLLSGWGCDENAREFFRYGHRDRKILIADAFERKQFWSNVAIQIFLGHFLDLMETMLRQAMPLP